MAPNIRLDAPVNFFAPDDQSTFRQPHGRLLSKESSQCSSQLLEDRLAQALTAMPEVGADFLGFHLSAELGRGGIARVFLAKQADLANRPVVIKIAADLWGEANTLAQLHHPNIVPVYSAHCQEPFQAFCMPYQGWTTLQDLLYALNEKPILPTSGQFLGQVIKKIPVAADGAGQVSGCAEETCRRKAFDGYLRRLSYVDAILWLAVQLADGLAHAHEHGIVHHDLKPANVLLSDEGRPLLLDFNAAQDIKKPSGSWISGTVPYMAPEQLAALQGSAGPVDARCDLYSFGIILFELLTGHYPFGDRDSSKDPLENILAKRQVSPPRLRDLNPNVSYALEAIVRHCLELAPCRRYQSARDLQEDLKRQHTHRPLLHVLEPSPKERFQKWVRRLRLFFLN